MAIITTFRVSGDPDDLYRRGIEQIEPKLAPVAARNGCLGRVIAKDANGLRFYHLWENEEGMQATADEVNSQIGEMENFPEQEDWQQFEVVHSVIESQG